MKSRILRSMSIFGLFFMLAGAGIQAQGQRSAEVNIPFDFAAGKAKLKAGRYTIKRTSDRTISLRNGDGETKAILHTPLTLSARNSEAGERLVFKRYGERYFLSEVWLRVDSGRQLFATGEESRVAREFKMNKSTPKRVDVALVTQ
jgi:hypothetical protein